MTLARFAPLLALSVIACGAPEPSETAAPAAPASSGDAALRSSIDTAAFQAPVAEPTAPQPAVIRAQVMLDRARFSPGVIDGLGGENTRQAIAAFEEANELPVDGQLDQQVFDRLAQADASAALMQYTITPQDVAGPFIGQVPEGFEAQAQLQTLGYATAQEALAEKFHMDEDLLTMLNPGASFAAGQVITVASVSPQQLPAAVGRIEINKAERAVRVFGEDGALIAFYPATIGSEERQSLSGSMTVRVVAPRPTYTYDPSRLSFGEGKEVLTIAAGPNNPVGAVWIDLSKDTYGIHGTPDPSEIGKTVSNGCVRLTNWNVQQLAASVKPGVAVRFV